MSSRTFVTCPSCGVESNDSSKYCASCGAHLVRERDSDRYLGALVAGKFRIEERIGEGGMGRVYRARQTSLDKVVVLKVLRSSLLSDERTVERFKREAKAASRLNHPNSIAILDFGQTDEGALFIGMEYVNGKDLHQILSREGMLSEARAIRIMSQVLSALADAHGAGVVHRDLKPENIMVEQRRGEPDFVKVLDFGIAKITDPSGEQGPALTRTGFVCGTPEYMAPEQARGGTVDHRSDLYAVGVILYQLLTGMLPFDSDSAVGFATKHLTEEPIPPTKRRPEAKISSAMERLILKSMAKEPSQRPRDAEAFRSELLALGRERPDARKQKVFAPKASSPTSKTDVTVRSPAAHAALDSDGLTARTEPGATQGSSSERWAALLTRFSLGGLALVAVGFAGLYAYQLVRPPPGSQPIPAPVQEQGSTEAEPIHVDSTQTEPLYERNVLAELRNQEEALRLTREADAAHRRGDDEAAIARYREAFEVSPAPELSLKLGELYYRRGEVDDARGFWGRHLKDNRDSKARNYITALFPDLGGVSR